MNDLEKQVNWKEQKFQEKLAQILEIIGTDFYYIFSEISEERELPFLDKDKDEKIINVKREFPTFQGEQGSRPDIYLETNKGNIIVFELKPNENFDENQIENHDQNMKNWVKEDENKGKVYKGVILLLNRDSERDNLNFKNNNIFWTGWDSIYKALTELKINILDSTLRNDIDRILSETPVIKLNETLKNQLLRETDKSSIFKTIRTTVLVIELMDQLKSQMGLEEILKRYEPIKGIESHKEITEKSGVLFNSIFKAINNEFQDKDYCAKIEKSDYNDWITLNLIEWRGYIDIDFRPFLNHAEDNVLVKLYMQSGKKNSMLKPLINLFHNDLQKFEEIEKKFKDSNIEWYCQFGASSPINVEKKNMTEIEQREFLPIYCDKKIRIYERETDEIYSDIAEVIPNFITTYLQLLNY